MDIGANDLAKIVRNHGNLSVFQVRAIAKEIKTAIVNNKITYKQLGTTKKDFPSLIRMAVAKGLKELLKRTESEETPRPVAAAFLKEIERAINKGEVKRKDLGL